MLEIRTGIGYGLATSEDGDRDKDREIGKGIAKNITPGYSRGALANEKHVTLEAT
jgi:hypothetical protein